MDTAKCIRRRSRGSGTTTTILALLLVACLAESASGSCLSYGHSCWGAHGKRSARPPISASDWYMTRLLRRMASNAEMNRERQLAASNDDINSIFQSMDISSDTSANEKPMPDSEEMPMESAPRGLDAKPMLDDDLLSKIKIWQMMKEASQEN